MRQGETPDPRLWTRVAGRFASISLRTWLWSGIALALLFSAYVSAGFYLVPGLIRSQGTAWVKTNLDKPLALGAVRFNPLTFTLDASDVAIPGRDGPMVALGHLRLRFAILSVFQSAYRFTDVTLDRPFIHAVIRPDGSLNLIELQPRTHSEGPAPAVRISNLSVNDGRVTYADQSRASQAEETLAPITFTLQDFQTDEAKGGAFTLNAKSTRDETFVWTGHLSIAPIASQGRLKISGLRSDTVQKFLGDRLPVTLTGGSAGLMADYDFAYGPDGMQLNLSLPEVALSGLSLTGGKGLFQGSAAIGQLSAQSGPIQLASGKDGIVRLTAAMPSLELQSLVLTPPGAAAGQDIKLASLALTDARLDYGARKLELGKLTLDGADAFISRAKDGKLNLLAMAPQPASATPGNTGSAPAWTISLAQFALNGATLRWQDQAVTPAAQWTITPLTLTLTGAGSDLSQPVNFHAEAHLEGKASFQGDGAITPATNAGDIKFTLAGLPLRSFLAYMPSFKGLELRSGAANASGTAHFQGGDLTRLRYRGEAVIDDFDIRETTTDSPLFAWRSFAFKGIDFQKNNLQISQASLVQPLGRVAVLPDRSFNFTSLMTPAGTTSTAVPIQAPPASAKPARPAPTFQIKRLDISRGVMGFADYSMQPNFEARIDALKGSITNITNRPDQVAAIDLTGQVIDQFSPASIKGTMDLLGYARKTDMDVSFHNIELPIFNPYSGRYAGYAIAKGKLATELHYKIDNRILTADHHVIIDQLEWGQATDSKEAVPLPIRLATALLRDKNGVIDLDLPVTGSLDDPKFRIWPIIWQIVGNVIEKAVTAPFQLIGSLFAGADKAQYVDFAPGSADLPQGSAEALAALAKGLDQRPGLKLDIPAGPAIREDAARLAEASIDGQLLAKDKGKVTDVAALDADELHDRLEDLYRAKLGKRPAFPDFSADQLKAAPGAKSDADDDDRRTLLEAQWMRSELHTAFLPNSAQLAALGTARATAVRNALLADNGIDPARLFMAADLAVTATDGQCRLELKLE